MKHITRVFLTLSCILVYFHPVSACWVPEAGTSETRPFQESGQIVRLAELFEFADSAPVENGGRSTSLGVVLVTKTGVYSFLETPENENRLDGIRPGTFVELTGDLLVSGRLVQIENLVVVPERMGPRIDLERLRHERGQPVQIVGTNLCKCGLEVGSLAHSCKLGHLHHLQTADGKIYHYLPGKEGSALYLGGANHFRRVEITGQEFSGNYLRVVSSRRLED